MTGTRTIRISAAIFIFCLTFVILYGQVSAQEIAQRFGVSLIGGTVKMVGGDVDRSTIDQWAGAEVRYGYSERVGFTAGIAYGWVRARDPDGSQFQSVGGFKTILIPMNANVSYYLTPQSRFRTYLSAGIGVTMWAIRKLGDGTTAFSTGTSVGGNQLDATLISGAGIEYFITRHYLVNMMVNYHQLLKGNEDTIGLGDDANSAIIELRLGVSYLWGGYRDKDGDGIDDRYDLDPRHKEDFDGFQDEDGAPDPDNDEDGISDSIDKAPNDPEDIDGFQDEDGVPDPDNDGDGIPDTEDKCPDIAEDFDGFEDDDGCPDFDNDKDGIPDSLDKCPNWPEDFNDYLDKDGCPDEQPEPEPIEINKSIILQGISFSPGSYKISPKSYLLLDDILHILIDYPNMKIEIRGYTDNTGSYQVNKLLSERRASAIKKYLTDKGIKSNRLKAIGCGGENPIADNSTAEGRAANRRIEFMRIK